MIIVEGCIMDERDLRKNKITLMVQLYYKRIPFLQLESLEDVTKKALDKYLDTDLSIEEINDLLAEAVMDRKRDLGNTQEINAMLEEKEKLEEEKKEQEVAVQKRKLKPGVKNEEGMISSMIITTLALISFSLSCIGLIILYLLKL